MNIREISEIDFGNLAAEITTTPEFIYLVTFGLEESGGKTSVLKSIYKKYGVAVETNYDLLRANRDLTKRLLEGAPQ